MQENSSLSFENLKKQLSGELYTDSLRRYMLATDGSIFKLMPSCVVYPKTRDDVVQVIHFARENGMTIHPRGAGSGLCGSALGEGIVLDFTKFMNRLLTLNMDEKWFECEPGYRFGELESELKGTGLFFPPDPSSGEYASFGGMYGTNASGAHSVKYGNVADYIIDAEVLLADGSRHMLSEIENTDPDRLPENLSPLVQMYSGNKERIETAYPDIKCNVAGYNLRDLAIDNKLRLHKLLAGSEGTLGIVTRLQFRLKEKPSYDSLVVAFFDDIISSAKAAQKAIPKGPSGIEIMDKSLLSVAMDYSPQLREKIPPDIDNLLLIEFDAMVEEEAKKAAEEARDSIIADGLTERAYLAATAAEKAQFWDVRKAAVPILYKLKGEKKILALIEDAAISIDKLVDYFEGIYKILNRHNLQFVVYGHIAKGLMHTRPLLNLKDESDVALLKVLADEVYEMVAGLGGTVSGEHGDGRLRSAYIKRRYPDIYPLFLKTKQTLDPHNLFNPEIKTQFDPDLMSSDLRFGVHYDGKELFKTELNWSEGFLNMVEACHGCSKCTTVTTATRMCPIYKVTRDESASPKAKGNILRSLISGAFDSGSLYEKDFQQVINLCVNCGSCYKECPSNVNIPKLALEAKAQYISQHGPSFHNRLVTNIENAARYSGRLSLLAGPLMKLSPVRKIAERVSGVSAERDFVPFSPYSLQKRFPSIVVRGETKSLYFAGCYASYIRPEIGAAAIKVLNHLGMGVAVPEQHCCGLPFLSKGMVRQARDKINANLEKWYDDLKSVDHLVVTCSSCGLSLLQEWSYLLQDGDVVELIQSKMVHISTLVNRNKDKLPVSEQRSRVGYHMPCHFKVQPEAQSSLEMLNNIKGVDAFDLESHCCGMAGSWGLAKENFQLSKAIAGDMVGKLDRSDAEVGATDCPTCRMQLEQFSRKPILHPIEIVASLL